MKNYLHNRATGLFQRDFWHGECTAGNMIRPGKLCGYYEDLRKKTHPFQGPTSNEGVPLVQVSRNRYVLHPVTVCQVALGWYERWLDEGGEEYLEVFLELADWLVENQTKQGKLSGVWLVPYEIPLYSLSSHWISGLVQGQAISVLTRAYKETNKDVYLNTSEQALLPLSKDVSRGGLRITLDNGIAFEEYPSPIPSLVLNGYISALWGIYDFKVLTGDSQANQIFEQGMMGLISLLPNYDTGYWSRYSLFKRRGFSNLASPYYHQEHIVQLKVMELITGEGVFGNYSEIWTSYGRSLANNGRVIAAKLVSRLTQRLLRSEI